MTQPSKSRLIWVLAAGGLVLLLVGGLSWFQSFFDGSTAVTQPTLEETLPTATSTETVLIRYDDNGYMPAVVTINVGQAVEFQNDSSSKMWPASDPHPTHIFYPEFNSQRPINPGESWRFTFMKAGSWGFHDHLRSGRTGTVVVR